MDRTGCRGERRDVAGGGVALDRRGRLLPFSRAAPNGHSWRPFVAAILSCRLGEPDESALLDLQPGPQRVDQHRDWPRAWRSPEPRPDYDVVIVGGGGHGLATAYYLAKEHGISNVAVLEKGWLGGGNTGRNTTIVRSNYLWDAARILRACAEAVGGPERDLNFNVMFSQRGVLNLAQPRTSCESSPAAATPYGSTASTPRC